MSVGVWEPDKQDKPQQAVSEELLRRFIGVAGAEQETVSADDLVRAGVNGENWVMTAEAAAWQVAESLETDDIIALVRLFTLVEQQVAGWGAGKKSPVIPLVKLLKGRDAFTPALRKWIKAHTDNRYLPNGSAL